MMMTVRGLQLGGRGEDGFFHPFTQVLFGPAVGFGKNGALEDPQNRVDFLGEHALVHQLPGRPVFQILDPGELHHPFGGLFRLLGFVDQGETFVQERIVQPGTPRPDGPSFSCRRRW